jgi:hypothetical protein
LESIDADPGAAAERGPFCDPGGVSMPGSVPTSDARIRQHLKSVPSLRPAGRQPSVLSRYPARFGNQFGSCTTHATATRLQRVSRGTQLRTENHVIGDTKLSPVGTFVSRHQVGKLNFLAPHDSRELNPFPETSRKHRFAGLCGHSASGGPRAGAQLDFGALGRVLCFADDQTLVRDISTQNRPPKSALRAVAGATLQIRSQGSLADPESHSILNRQERPS